MVFILLELLLVFIGLITHSNLFINENDPSNRKLLSIDLTPLTRKQEIMIKHTVLYINEMSNEERQVLKQYGDIVEQITTDNNMKYKDQYDVLASENNDVGNNILLHGIKHAVMDLLNNADKLKNAYKIMISNPVILKLSQILKALGMNEENCDILVREMIPILDQLSGFIGNNKDYTNMFNEIALRGLFEEEKASKTVDEFERVFADVHEFDEGSMMRNIFIYQKLFVPMIRYVITVDNIEPNALYQTLSKEIPGFDQDHDAMDQFLLMAQVFFDEADTPEKKQVLANFASLIADIEITDADEKKLNTKLAHVYAKTHGMENGAFLWDIWGKVVQLLIPNDT